MTTGPYPDNYTIRYDETKIIPPPHIQFDSFGISTTETTGMRLIGVPICPDLLDFSALGEADNLRGRIIRIFFRALDRILPP